MRPLRQVYNLLGKHWYAKSTVTYTDDSNNTCYLTVSSILVLPTGRIVIGTTKGIYASDDSGNTWTQIYNDTSNYKITALIRLDDGTILAGINKTVYQSSDNGQTWTSGQSFISNIIKFSKGPADTVFAIVAVYVKISGMANTTNYTYLYKSLDNGVTWTRETLYTGSKTDYRAANSIITIGNCVFIGVCSTLGVQTIYKLTYDSDNDSWSTTDFSGPCMLYVIGQRIFASYDSVINAYSLGILYSDDLGETWTTLSSTESISCMCKINNRIVAAFMKKAALTSTTGSGVRYSDDNGITWHDTDLANSLYYNLVIYTDTLLIAPSGTSQKHPVLFQSSKAADITNKPLNKAMVQALIDECKAYVQSKKQV